jgi:hypothetical protein
MTVDVSTTQSPVAVSVNDTTVSVVVTGGIGPQGPAGSGYTLPAATTSILGGIIVGSNLSVTADGTLSATGGGAVSSVAGRTGAVTLTTADVGGLGSLATQSGTFSGTSSGTNTGDQTITLTGDVTGSGTGSFAATLAASGASAGTYTSVTVDAKGRVTAGTNPAGYSLPTATNSVLGGIKIGSGLSIDGAGVVTAAGSTDASTLTSGTLPDERLSANVALAANVNAMFHSGNGVDTLPRFVNIVNQTFNSVVFYTFFTAQRSVSVSAISVACSFGGSGFTSTRMALVSFDETTTTILARCASDTTLFTTTNTLYTRSFATAGGYPASYNLVAGNRYGVALLQVGGTTTGLYGLSLNNNFLSTTSPRICFYGAAVSGDIPATQTAFTQFNIAFWARLS